MNWIGQKEMQKACGPDEIPYEFYKYAPEQIIEKILNVFNQYWNKGQYPKKYKNIIRNPINKPGKNSAEVESYMYISKISILGKIFENIITKRQLVAGDKWYIR